MTSYLYCVAFGASAPGFYPAFREQSGCSPSRMRLHDCNGIMSNPTMNPNQQSQPAKAPLRFFTWVRSSGLVRGDDRWIGGVCSGIAQRLGWSPTLVRALMIVAALFFGFGAALYAMGWFLLPDVRNGHILAENLIEGQWDWSCLGCLLFIAVAVVIPGAGWVCIALAALVLWLIAQSGVRQREGYGFGYHSGQSGVSPNNPNNLAQNPSVQPSATMPPYVSRPVSQSSPICFTTCSAGGTAAI